MEITYFGKTEFKIKGKQKTVILNDKGKAGAVIKNESGGDGFVIGEPGEYEIGGVSVLGIPNGKNTIFIIEMENLRIALVAGLEQKLSQEQLEEIGGIDILLVDAALDVEVTKQIDPWIVIPVSSDQIKINEYLKEMGKSDLQPIPKLTTTFERLPEEMQVIVLDRK